MGNDNNRFRRLSVLNSRRAGHGLLNGFSGIAFSGLIKAAKDKHYESVVEVIKDVDVRDVTDDEIELLPERAGT